MRGEKRVAGTSTLRIAKAQPVHMGRYICLEESTKERSSIYVYVKGSPGTLTWTGVARTGGAAVAAGERRVLVIHRTPLQRAVTRS